MESQWLLPVRHNSWGRNPIHPIVIDPSLSLSMVKGPEFLSHLIIFFLWCACAYGLLEILASTGAWWWESKQIQIPGSCQADGEVGMPP